MSQTLREEFETQGFVRVPLLSAPETEQLRRTTKELFASRPVHLGDTDDRGALGAVRADIFPRYPQFRWVLAHQKARAALKELFGPDFVLLPESAAHRAGYGDWHKDTNAQEGAGEVFHWARDFNMGQCAIYLQDNSEDFGGGLSVVPGSHRAGLLRRNLQKATGRARLFVKYKLRSLIPDMRGFPIPSRAGELVVFHYRLDHRATPAVRPVPPEREKLAIFFAVSENNRHARKYCDFLATRADAHFLKDRPYPEDFQAFVRDNGLAHL